RHVVAAARVVDGDVLLERLIEKLRGARRLVERSLARLADRVVVVLVRGLEEAAEAVSELLGLLAEVELLLLRLVLAGGSRGRLLVAAARVVDRDVSRQLVVRQVSRTARAVQLAFERSSDFGVVALCCRHVANDTGCRTLSLHDALPILVDGDVLLERLIEKLRGARRL